MQPLDMAQLELPDDMRNDPDVIRYIHLVDKTMRAEIVSAPDEWSPAQTDAYKRDDWEAFSRLRGYTEEEISAFGQSLELCLSLSERYGDDDVAWICYTIQEQTGILGLTPQEILAWESPAAANN